MWGCNLRGSDLSGGYPWVRKAVEFVSDSALESVVAEIVAQVSAIRPWTGLIQIARLYEITRAYQSERSSLEAGENLREIWSNRPPLRLRS